jgi:cysteine desulfurase
LSDPLIYLDHAATTALSADAYKAMIPYLSDQYGNPSSLYQLGQVGREAVDWARQQCAAVLSCRPSEIIFTSGGTESDNAALMGVALAQAKQGRHVVTTAIEHHAVLATGELLEELGFTVTYVEPDADGVIHPSAVEAAITPETSIVSVMLANNETGVVQPIAEIASVVREAASRTSRTIAMHTDAVQAPGSLNLDVDALGVDLLSLSAHKFNGPKGVGLLYLRRGTPFRPIHVGGAQERDRRAGTENVAGIVGMSVALENVDRDRATNASKSKALATKLLSGIMERVDGVHVNGDVERRLPGNVNVSFSGIESEPLLVALDVAGIAASSGSACTAGSIEPSHVLRAMGMSDELARASLRLTLGPENTEDEVDRVVEVIATEVPRIRSMLT